jgi:hypothetical protein
MANSGVAETVGTLSGRIGRYFNIVSSLPSAVFVSYVFLLVSSGAWSGPVRMSDALAKIDLKQAALLALLSFVAALALHPLQFSIIQLFEGYWGTSALARQLAVVRTRHHRRRLTALRRASGEARLRLRELEDLTGAVWSHAADRLLPEVVRQDESDREWQSYPESVREVLPTRLGNVLRRYEQQAGAAYGIQAIAAVPRIGMVAGEKEVIYVQDQRLQLELAVRTAFLALLAAAVTVLFMWRHGLWMLLALGPYALGYLSYRGAVVVAHEYGTALAVLIELNRFTLYERLRQPQPGDSVRERKSNDSLMRAFAHDRNVRLVYAPPAPSDVAVSQPPAEAEDQQGEGDETGS